MVSQPFTRPKLTAADVNTLAFCLRHTAQTANVRLSRLESIETLDDRMAVDSQPFTPRLSQSDTETLIFCLRYTAQTANVGLSRLESIEALDVRMTDENSKLAEEIAAARPDYETMKEGTQ